MNDTKIYKICNITSNNEFLLDYAQYLVPQFRKHYFKYDAFKKIYKNIKQDKGAIKENMMSLLEEELCIEIFRIDEFLYNELFVIQSNMSLMKKEWNELNPKERESVIEGTRERTIERTMRSLFEKCILCHNYWRLNNFAIRKVAKKYEKLIKKSEKNKNLDEKKDENKDNEEDNETDFLYWKKIPSYQVFENYFVKKSKIIDALKNECVEMYSLVFRTTYSSLVLDELEYVKNRNRDNDSGRIGFGVKLGIMVMLVLLLLAETFYRKNNVDFWGSSGIYIFTSVGNIIFFKFIWSCDVVVWDFYQVNYISLLRLKNIKPNAMQIANETATLAIIFFSMLLLYYHSKSPGDPFESKLFSDIIPIALVIILCIHFIYKLLSKYNVESQSDGLFNKSMVYKFIFPTAQSPTFRDIFAADHLTSFTRMISDSVWGACYIFSGALIYPEYVTPSFLKICKVIVGIFVCSPLWIRLLQCFRVLYDTKLLFPHFANSLKYLSSMVVVIWGLTSPSPHDPNFLWFIIVTAIYKWWWDIVMDWGLMDNWAGPKDFFSCLYSNDSVIENKYKNFSLKKYILRPKLMYDNPIFYYMAIIIDLLLRFSWTVSLSQVSQVSFLSSPGFSLFIGGLEIFRRAMWGVFRVEYEHLKYVAKKAPGFLEIEKSVIKQRVNVRPKPLCRIVSLLDNHIAQLDIIDDDEVALNYENDQTQFGLELVEKYDEDGLFFDEHDIESNIMEIYTIIPSIDESMVQIEKQNDNDIIIETEF